MLTRLPVLLFAFLASAASLAAMDRVVTRGFPAGPGCHLVLDSYRGEVTVSQSSNDPWIRITVTARVTTSDPAIASAAFDTLHLAFGAEGQTVRVTARDPSQADARLDWMTDRHVDLFYAITLPPGCGADLTDGDGSITVNDARGAFAARLTTGRVFFRGIDGSSTISVQNGGVTVSHCSGPVDADVLIGSIQAGTIGGPSRMVTHRGDIGVQHVLAGLDARCAAGDITAGFPKGFSGQGHLVADGGNVTAIIDPGAACTIRALASVWGTVTAGLPLAVLSGGLGKDHLEGTLGGGGPILDLHAAGGYVKILPPYRPHPLKGLP